MINKLKQFADSVKGILLFIVGPILGVLAYISYLRGQLTTAKDEVAQSKAEKQLATVIEKKVEDEKQSDEAELDYNTIRAQYIAAHPTEFSGPTSEGTPLQQSDQSSGQSNSTKGSSS